MRLIPYLMFSGRCREAFEFYRDALGGEIEFIGTYGESPMRDQMPPESYGQVMHASLRVGDVLLMGADGSASSDATERNYVNIDVDSIEDAERVWAAITEGATVQMPLQETFWALRWGMLIDRFGQPWMVNAIKPCG